HYMVAMAGGDSIRCASYATFGTQALSETVIEALRDRSAALMAHHGMVCYGADLDRVLSLAIEVETLARIYLQALAVGEPPVLPAGEMAEILHRFKDYRP
ncbi:MAG: class II aldolase/adducin family protein, partial [Proteobacteria bacterium]|nr:class II aldolase/adducin family protein [Pseudomonadota bacterium]